jgi:hypothetical protein
MVSGPVHDERDTHRETTLRRLPLLVALSAAGFSTGYIASDLIALAQGGFSPPSSRSPMPPRLHCRCS